MRALDRQTYVWCIGLDDWSAEADRLQRHLDDDETARARVLAGDRERVRFVVAHAALRQILGACCGESADRLRFLRSSPGRPELVGHRVRFNLSYGDGWALVVVSGAAVGVDLERIRPTFPVMRFAERFFLPSEAEHLARVPEPERAELFFRYWTIKEALVKARGTGLADLSCASVRYSSQGPQVPGFWTAAELCPVPGYAAAVVQARPGVSLRCRTWVPGR
jgi:4'-phosphopantetheinyl transferase